MQVHLDALDTKILRLLQFDARLTNKEIADKLGSVSASTIYDRRKKLEDSGVIKQYVVILNKDLIGKSMIVYTTIHLKEHSTLLLRNFEKEAIKFKEVMECSHLSGSFDFLLKIAVGDHSEYTSFLMDKLGTLPNIREIQTFLVFSEYKAGGGYALELPGEEKKAIRK